MGVMPDIEAEAARAVRAARKDFNRIFGHHASPELPAQRPVNLAAAPAAAAKQEDTMSLTTIESDVKAYLTDGLDYLDGMVARLKQAAPGIIETTEAVGGSTVAALVEAVAGRVLPPQLEQVLAAQVADFVSRWGAPAQAAPVQPQQAVPAQ